MATVTVQLRNKQSGALSAPVVVSYSVAAPVLFGMTPDDTTAAVTAALSGFPGIRYIRDFGTSAGTILRHTNPRQALPPVSAVRHVSCKATDPAAAFSAFLDDAPTDRLYFVTYYHEPMGDVDPSLYRARGQALADMLAAHPKRGQVLGNGPIVTRYWLDQKPGTNPDDWFYTGATFYATDCYNNDSARYRTPEEMFGSAARIARERGVPFLIPEWGVEKITSDTSGAGRAAAITDGAAWLREQPDCMAAGWWQIGGDFLADPDPGAQAYRQVLAAG